MTTEPSTIERATAYQSHFDETIIATTKKSEDMKTLHDLVSSSKKLLSTDINIATTDDMDFSSIRKVLEKSREIAEKDYQSHLNSMLIAITEDDKKTTFHNLIHSSKSLLLTENALENLTKAEAAFRNSTISLIKGDTNSAVNHAAVSSENLEQVSVKLSQYNELAPESKFFSTALKAIIKLDQAAGKLENEFSLKSDEFSIGLKVFSQKISYFAKSIAQFPAKVTQNMKENSTSVIQSLKDVSLKISAGFRNMFDKTQTTTKDTAGNVSKSAMVFISESAGKITDAKKQVNNASDVIARHGAAVLGLGAVAAVAATNQVGKVMESISFSEKLNKMKGTIVSAYREQLDKNQPKSDTSHAYETPRG